jgi:hypothetical protein
MAIAVRAADGPVQHLVFTVSDYSRRDLAGYGVIGGARGNRP